MKASINIILFVSTILLNSCKQESFIQELFITPDAGFEINKTVYDVHESVYFVNTGKGQHFVVYPGDSLHVFNQPFNQGYATASDGTFSYAYNEPGEYTAVWIASSINNRNEIIESIDSMKISVVAKDGGLDRFTVFNIYKMPEYPGSVFFSSVGEFIAPDTLMCPVFFDSWRPSLTVNSFKAPQLINFSLSSSLSKFYWVDGGVEKEIRSGLSSSRIVKFLSGGKMSIQKFIVKTASGFTSEYYVAPVIIPKMTKYTVNGKNGVITRDIAYYNKFIIDLTLPAGTDLTSLKPDFEIMNNDPDLIDGTNITISLNEESQTSGVSIVDATSKKLQYKLIATMPGYTNPKLIRETIVDVVINLQ